jgi:hypothetical protein
MNDAREDARLFDAHTVPLTFVKPFHGLPGSHHPSAIRIGDAQRSLKKRWQAIQLISMSPLALQKSTLEHFLGV